MYIFGIRARTSLTLLLNFAAMFPPCFRPRPPRPFPRTEFFVPLHRNLTSRSVPRSFSRAPGRK